METRVEKPLRSFKSLISMLLETPFFFSCVKTFQYSSNKLPFVPKMVSVGFLTL